MPSFSLALLFGNPFLVFIYTVFILFRFVEMAEGISLCYAAGFLSGSGLEFLIPIFSFLVFSTILY